MKKIVITFVVAAIAGIGIISVYQPPTNCVSIYVDYGSLSSNPPIESCIPTAPEANGLELLYAAKLSIEGTQKYGNSVVCRVNGLPNATVETCESMPPEKAYWAVYTREYEAFPIPFNTEGEWGWAQTGIDEVLLNPGDSLGLVFIENGEVRYP
jgi:hypothetical protein